MAMYSTSSWWWAPSTGCQRPGSRKDRGLDPRIDRHLHTGAIPETHRDSSATPGSGHALGGRLDPTPRPQLEQLNRALVVLSACNKAVATASSEDELLQHACEAIVRVGGYRLSWVGYAEHDADKRVRPVAQFGFDQGYVESVRITWGEDNRGRGPTGMAIRTARPQIAQRIATDPRFEPWRADALERGYGSSIALPLVVEGVPLGALLIYAAEPDAFDDAEALMLMQAADDLALGIARQRADCGPASGRGRAREDCRGPARSNRAARPAVRERPRGNRAARHGRPDHAREPRVHAHVRLLRGRVRRAPPERSDRTSRPDGRRPAAHPRGGRVRAAV